MCGKGCDRDYIGEISGWWEHCGGMTVTEGLREVDYVGRTERSFTVMGEDCEGEDHAGDNVRGRL